MSKLHAMILTLYTFSTFSADNSIKQYDLCSNRNNYVKGLQSKPQGWCAFCDKDNLAQNDIIKDPENNVMIMMNQNPYTSLDRAHHLMITSISHHENLTCFSLAQLRQQVNCAYQVSNKLYDDAYTQEIFVNMGGKPAGGSVPHSHIHIKSYMQKPCLAHEAAWQQKLLSQYNRESAFELVKSKLTGMSPLIHSTTSSYVSVECHGCQVKDCLPHFFSNGLQCNGEDYNFIIGKYKHNMVYISHDQKIAGEVVVMPYKHVSCIRDLSSDEIMENMALATALVIPLTEYAKKIREGEVGCNVFIKNVCGKACDKQKQNYHIITRLMPRTIIYAPPGTLEGNSCKIECDLFDLFAYLKRFSSLLQEISDDYKS